MGKLEVQLKAYVQQGLYPMHMPGHKRRLSPGEDLPCSWDLTEVDGVDDLHQPEGILKEAMERTAALHGASRTWYLVNGSTCGLLAGIRALAPEGSHILIARNCHKAVYHAIELGNLQVHYLIPSVLPQIGVYGSIKPEDVETALQGCPKIRCVVVTSPTYEGVLSDIASIAARMEVSGQSRAILSAIASELRGPVAIMTLPSGISAASSLITSIFS